MSNARRVLATLVLFGGAALTTLVPQLSGQAPRRAGGRFVGGQPAIIQGAGPEGTRTGYTDAVTFPTDRKAKRSLDLAEDFIKGGEWGEAARVLQSLLDTKEDVFVEVKRDGSPRWTSLRGEANRLLGSMPLKGREFYELQYGARAKARLAEAQQQGDPQILAEVSLRYLHTDAGARATDLLGTHYLDRGDFVMAALCYERLLNHEKLDQLPPITLLKAALAFRRAQDKNLADQAWERLTRVAGAGLTVGDRTVSVADLQKEFDRYGEQGLANPFDWTMFKGNPSRSAEGNGTAPFLEAAWTMSTIREPETEQWVKEALKRQQDRQQPVIPAFFPIAATAHNKDGSTRPLVVYRSYYGVHAIDLRDGKEFWNSPAAWSLDRIAEDPNKSQQLRQWLPLYLDGNPNLLFENATVGTLSTDNTRVYAVDDLALPPHPNSQQLMALGWGAPATFGSLHDAVYHNRLEAFELSTGKLVWEVGSHASEKDDLKETYFLGPPLPLGGKLYVLTERASELLLLCLDAQRGEVLWSQSLANVRDKLLVDVGRRMEGINLAYGDGILVCPTNAGAILAVDLLTHSLVWANSYREEAAAADQNPAAPVAPVFPGRFGVSRAQLNTDWKASAPVIQDGKVIFTAADGPAVYCLNLRDGQLIWKQSRGDDLYLGGVYNGKVILVGRSLCRALALADGKEVWKVETGLPSGQGVASGSIYYLPLRSLGQSKEPVVASIDMETGKLTAATKSRKKEAPGNLMFFEGEVLSQTATDISAFPQLRIRLAQIEKALQRDPNDPVGLTDRGELKLDKGDLKGAVEDLQSALAHKPPADLLPRARSKLFDTLTELLQHDFNASESYLAEYKEMCKVAIPPDASADERRKLEDEQQHRQANYLSLLAKGREEQGRVEDALQAYLDFGVLVGNRDLVSVVGEPAIHARPDIWAQGRIAAMVAKTDADRRRLLEERIAQQWKAIKSTPDVDALRRFVSMFGSLFTVGKEARLQLAERLMTDESGFLEAELQLVQLRRQDDRVLAARATEALARLMIQKGLMEDAVYYYRALAREYGDVPVRDGQMGADFLNEMNADKRLLPYLEASAPEWTGHFKARTSMGQYNAQLNYVFETPADAPPYFQRSRLTLQNGNQVRIVDRGSNADRWNLTLPSGAHQFNNMNFFNAAGSHIPFAIRGHFWVLNAGQMVYGLDPVNQKVLWQKSLFGAPVPGQFAVTGNPQGGWFINFPDGRTEYLGQLGPAEASYVCLLTRDGLTALDPLRGTVLWTRADISMRTRLFGDDQFVYLVETQSDGSTNAGRALRALDGVSVPVPEFGALYQRRRGQVGRDLLLSETENGETALRLYDIQTGKDIWKKSFSRKAMLPARVSQVRQSEVIHSADPEITAIIEPDRDGKLTILDVRTGRELMAARVDPNDLEKLQEIHLLQDRDGFYVAVRRRSDPQKFNQGPWPNVNPTIRSVGVNGKIYAFDRATGKVRWRSDVPEQNLLIEQFQDLPIMLFTARFNRPFNPQAGGIVRGPMQNLTKTRSIDKRTGKLLFDKEYQNNYAQFFNAINVNQQAGTIDLVSYNMKIEHYQDQERGPSK